MLDNVIIVEMLHIIVFVFRDIQVKTVNFHLDQRQPLRLLHDHGIHAYQIILVSMVVLVFTRGIRTSSHASVHLVIVVLDVNFLVHSSWKYFHQRFFFCTIISRFTSCQYNTTITLIEYMWHL